MRYVVQQAVYMRVVVNMPDGKTQDDAAADVWGRTLEALADIDPGATQSKCQVNRIDEIVAVESGESQIMTAPVRFLGEASSDPDLEVKA